MNEQELLAKLKKIKALYEGALSDGEKQASAEAMKRVQERLDKIKRTEIAMEFKFCLSDLYQRRLWVAILRKNGISPYRYKRQKYTTVMARMPKSICTSLWNEFKELSEVLRQYLDELTNTIIQGSVHEDTSEATIIQGELTG